MVVGRGHDDRVHQPGTKQLRAVRKSRHTGQLLQAGGIPVHDGPERGALHLAFEQVPGVDQSDVAQADDADADGILHARKKFRSGCRPCPVVQAG